VWRHGRAAGQVRLIGLACAVAAALLIASQTPFEAAAQEGWVITEARISYDIQQDGQIRVVEEWAVDFGPLQKHGIFRDLVTKQKCEPPDEAAARNCPAGHNRIYRIDVGRITVNGQAAKWERQESGSLTRLKIGDPARTTSGKQVYRIEYTLRGALNGFDDQDQLYWNVIGEWPVPIEHVALALRLPGEATVQTLCFQGRLGSTQPCEHEGTREGTATFESTRQLFAREQLTIVAGWPAGVVAHPRPILEDPLTVGDLFALDAWEWGGMAVVAALTVIGLAAAWWRFGRDRAYKTLYYLTNDPTEGRRPLFGGRDIVIEYLPPENLRPAQMGVILDESADTLDVTATIIDLAVRKHLRITEIPKKGWFGSRDWKLEKLENEDDGMLPWEKLLYDAIFNDRTSWTKVSTMKEKFYVHLANVKRELYADAMAKQWFRMKPETAKWTWRAVGVGVIVLGAALAGALGLFAGRLLIGVPVALGGLFLLLGAGIMPARTAAGSEALRRVLGFRLYVATAEQRLQEFNEQANIFARYLPYAMVFGCVDKWAKAFEKLGMKPDEQTAGWYRGVTPFAPAAFATEMHSFSNSISSAMTSTPGGSGSSGFSGGGGGGGFSGGGGGGGGGGSW
jgi:uncharacterized membrane protein YgcG